jgi:uncharacterized OsmC-like protein
MSVVVERVEGKTLRVTSGNATVMIDGTGEAGSAGFRSVDLLLASLGSCMVGTMLTAAAQAAIPVTDVQVELRPVVKFAPDERVSRIRMKMTLAGDFSASDLETLRAAAESCKVHNSLHHGIETQLELATTTLAG